ncbi:MAG: tetratricopeptide repeat protein [gamma proteobacterium endosymbiont of Lamellibrachia anaximandri]|nr:tetratricopeptide repeat protein [gamma proteobacterium endosymbiont of Lamellibrachia anaximandri]
MSKPDPEKLSCLFDEFERQDTNDPGLEAELEHKTYRWRDVYVERGELGLLMERWKKVSDFQRVEEIQPQLAILLANSGFGKTRLVHKFYEEIVKRHQADGCRYWPPLIGRNNDTLTVNPPFDQVDLEQRLPFLWWGIQLPDQTTEKSTCKPVLNDSVRVLSSHLFSMEMARQKREVRSEIGQEVLNLALVTISKLTLIETAKDYYEIGKGIAGAINKAIGIKKEEKQTHTERERQEKKEFVDEIVENLSMLMNPDNSDMERIPMVLFIDDAQWIDCKQDNKSRPNTDLLELLGKIMRLARQEHWPIMIILTHWEEDWNKLRLSGDGVPYLLESGDKAEIVETYARTANPNYHGWEEWEQSIIRLGQFDLSWILKAALPGVYRDEGQRMRLIGKVVDGFQRGKDVLADNARYLDEFLKMLYQPANLEYLRGRSIDQPLIDDWEERMSKKLGGLEYARLVQSRFDQLKGPYRQTLCLSSYHGIEFPEKLTEVISRYLYGPKYGCPWTALEDPETFIQRNVKYPSGVSRFPDSVYKSIAYEALSPEHKQKLKEILPRLLSYWLYYGSFSQGLEALDLNLAEDETLCEIALKVLNDCRSDSESLAREINADLASLVALSRLVRINRYRYNEQQAYRYALEFHESLVEPWGPGDIEFEDAIAIYNSLSLHQQHSAAIFIAQNINSDCIELDRLNDDQESKSNLSFSYGLLGEVAFDMQQPNEARAWHEKALEIDRLLAEQSPDPKTLHSLSVSFERLGDIAADMLRLAEAKRWYEQSLAIRSQLAEKSSSRQDLRSLSFAYGKLGGLALELLQLEEADSFYRKSLEIREQLLQRHSNPDTLRDLSLSLERLGDVAVAMNDFEKAQQFFHDMLDIKEILVEEAVTPQALRDLSIANKKLGKVARNMQQPDAAKAWHEKALEIDHLLTEKYPGPKTLLDLSITYLDLGDVVLDNQQPEDASDWYEQSLDIINKLLEKSSSPKVLSNQAIAYERLGNVAAITQQQEAAKAWYERALEIRRHQSEVAKNPQTLRDLSIMYGKLGDVTRDMQQPDDAKVWYEQAMEICRQLAENSSSPPALQDLSRMYEKLGNVARDMQQPEDAKDWYEQSLEIRRQLAENSSSPQTMRDLSIMYGKLGDVTRDMQQPEGAKEWYEQSLEIRRQLAENSSSPEALRDLSTIYEDLGNVASDMQQPERNHDNQCGHVHAI